MYLETHTVCSPLTTYMAVHMGAADDVFGYDLICVVFSHMVSDWIVSVRKYFHTYHSHLKISEYILLSEFEIPV